MQRGRNTPNPGREAESIHSEVDESQSTLGSLTTRVTELEPKLERQIIWNQELARALEKRR